LCGVELSFQIENFESQKVEIGGRFLSRNNLFEKKNFFRHFLHCRFDAQAPL
jgi:hypothetical protein